MHNYKDQLINLNFHDSSINSITIEPGDLFDRKVTIMIDYYNWEGNNKDSEKWIFKTLQLTINHCVHCQINAPNLMEDTFEIMSEEFDLMHDEFIEKAQQEMEKSYFVNLRSKQLDNFLSIKFNTDNYAKSLFGENAGFIWLAGFNVEHTWLGESIGSPIHIPAG